MSTLRTLIAARPETERDLIERAYKFARDAHAGVTRRSGEAYITHPVAVATILAELGMDSTSVAAGLLHDTVEDVEGVTFEVITEHFGPEVSRIVEGETKVSKLSKAGNQEAEVDEGGRDLQAENLRQMLIAMTGDIRIIVVKLADRLHNMRTMQAMPQEKQQRISRETIEVFAPLAHRLGIGQVKSELEDLSFRYLYPDDYAALVSSLEMGGEERAAAVRDAEHRLRAALAEDLELPMLVEHLDISGRSKHLWSIYKKMQKDGKSLEQIFDLLALRVIVTPAPLNLPEGIDPARAEKAERARERAVCYHILGIVNDIWTPLTGRYKDYLSVPKPNGYQSLHSTVVGRRGQPMEVQVRSARMHRVAEYGVAAHWMYKQGGAMGGREREEWLGRLRELQEEMGDAGDYIDAVKNDLLSQRVRVFTPKGKAVSLTAGSTPVDFAYHIHTRVGETMVGARINGKIVQLGTQLSNGDVVEILTSKNGTPSKDWLNFAATRSTRAKIRHFFRQDERAAALEHGQTLLERYLRKRGLAARKLMSAKRLEEVAAGLTGARDVGELFMALHTGKLSTGQVARKLSPELAAKKEQSDKQDAAQRLQKRAEQQKAAGAPEVYVEGLATATKLSQCCQPIRGDQIMGYLTRGRGVTIHRLDCPNMQRLLTGEPERCISASWHRKVEGRFEVNLDVIGPDRDGLLSEIFAVLKSHAMSPLRFEAYVNEQEEGLEYAHVCLRLGFSSDEQFTAVRAALLSIAGIETVRRTRAFGQHAAHEVDVDG